MIDFLLDEQDDIQLDGNGEIIAGQSDDQEAYNHLRCIKGDIRHEPLVGINLVARLRSNVTNSQIRAVIEDNLKRDGFESVKVVFKPNLNIQARR